MADIVRPCSHRMRRSSPGAPRCHGPISATGCTSFHELHRRLAAARPDVIVMFVNDHLQNFAYNNVPAFCVGLAEAYPAPSEGGAGLMRIAPRQIPGATEWARALLDAGLEGGIDFAYSYEIESWDEIAVPLLFLTPEGDVPILSPA